MRPVLHGDAMAVARVLRNLPETVRGAKLKQLIALAEMADAHRQKTGLAHPLWGNGSLMGVVQRAVRGSEPPLEDREYCQCLALVFEQLAGLAPAPRSRRVFAARQVST